MNRYINRSEFTACPICHLGKFKKLEDFMGIPMAEGKLSPIEFKPATAYCCIECHYLAFFLIEEKKS